MAKNWAIVVGINDYLHHPERKLNYAVNDAQRIGDFLSQQAGFGENQVIRCLGEQAQQGSLTYPTCSKLLQLLKQDIQPARLGKIDRLWFYFSGHGVSRNGRDYLITSDCWESEIERFGLSVDEVIAALRSHQTADIVLILDACRQVLDKKSFDDTIGKQTADVAKERGITTIFSCDYGQYSYELEALQQGAFTYALIEGLAQHTLPNQLEQYLRRQVPALNLQHRRERVEQTPRIRLESALQAFQPLLPTAVTAADLTVLVDWAREAELEENFEAAKQTWWQVIKVDRSGERVSYARTAIERLERKIARLSGDRSASASTVDDSETDSSSDAGAQLLSSPTQNESFTDGLAGLQALTGVDLSRPQLITSQQAGMAQAYALKMKLASENAKKFYKAAADISASSASNADQVPSYSPNSFSLSAFKFEVVTVNKRGEITNRQTKQAEFFVEDLGNGITLEMVKIPGGSFKMGSPETEEGRYSNESPQHTVTVPTFFIGKFAVTQAQYQQIIGSNPAHFKDEKRPVERVSWNDAIEFCQELSKRTKNTYRLPSEAEWEYACRAEAMTPFHFGKTIMSTLVNYDARSIYRLEPEGEYRQQTTDVDVFPPNAFGLYDMHGNIWEWCEDHWHDNYWNAPNDGSAWLSKNNAASRVLRGGSWGTLPRNCRSATRYIGDAGWRYYFNGFRVVYSASGTL